MLDILCLLYYSLMFEGYAINPNSALQMMAVHLKTAGSVSICKKSCQQTLHFEGTISDLNCFHFHDEVL